MGILGSFYSEFKPLCLRPHCEQIAQYVRGYSFYASQFIQRMQRLTNTLCYKMPVWTKQTREIRTYLAVNCFLRWTACEAFLLISLFSIVSKFRGPPVVSVCLSQWQTKHPPAPAHVCIHGSCYLNELSSCIDVPSIGEAHIGPYIYSHICIWIRLRL